MCAYELQCTKKQINKDNNTMPGNKVKNTQVHLFKGCRCRLQRCDRSLWQLPKMIQNGETHQPSCSQGVKDTNSVCMNVLGTLPEQKERALEGEPRPSGWTSSRRDCGLRERASRETATHAEQSKVIQCPQRDGKSVGLWVRKIKS